MRHLSVSMRVRSSFWSFFYIVGRLSSFMALLLHFLNSHPEFRIADFAQCFMNNRLVASHESLPMSNMPDGYSKPFLTPLNVCI